MKDRIALVLGTVAVLGTLVYGIASWDSGLCQRLPGCRELVSHLPRH